MKYKSSLQIADYKLQELMKIADLFWSTIDRSAARTSLCALEFARRLQLQVCNSDLWIQSFWNALCTTKARERQYKARETGRMARSRTVLVVFCRRGSLSLRLNKSRPIYWLLRSLDFRVLLPYCLCKSYARAGRAIVCLSVIQRVSERFFCGPVRDGGIKRTHRSGIDARLGYIECK